MKVVDEAVNTNDPVLPKIQQMDHWNDQTKAGLDWHIYAGDALKVLKELPSNTFHCVVTSPPYFWLRDYGVEHQIGKERTVDEYIQALVCVMSEVNRVLRRDGLLFLNIGDTYYSGKGEAHGRDRKNSKRRLGLRAVDESGGLGQGLKGKTLIGIPWYLAPAMTQQGWILRSPIIWNRHNALKDTAKDRPHHSYEYIFMFSKGRKYYFNREGLGADEDIWTISAKPKPTRGIKTAPFPDELVKRCLDIGCPPGGKVLDPFMGSGTTLRVALQSGREASGIDLNPEFCDFAVNMIKSLDTKPVRKPKVAAQVAKVEEKSCQMSLEFI